jgi:hypothetical protein
MDNDGRFGGKNPRYTVLDECIYGEKRFSGHAFRIDGRRDVGYEYSGHGQYVWWKRRLVGKETPASGELTKISARWSTGHA